MAVTLPTAAPTHVTRPARSRKTQGHPWWTLAAACVGVIMVGLDASVVAIANPRIAADLHASLPDLQWITDAYMLALASLLIFGGNLGDRYGRRLMFFVGVTGFAVTSVGIGLIGTVGGVITLRALQGVFGALLMPSTLAIVRATFPREKLNTAVGMWAGASGVSIAAGPIVGGLLVEHVNWQSVFYINAPIGVAALLLGGVAVVESRSAGDRHLDILGIATLSGGLFLLVFGLIKAQNWGWLAGRTLTFLVLGLGVIAVFVLIELRTSEPLLPMRLFANRSLSVGTAVVVVNFFALFGAVFFMSLYLQNVHGFSPVTTGVRTLPLSVALMVTAPLSGVLTNKFGPRPAMVIGLAAVAVGLTVLAYLHADSGYQALWPPFVSARRRYRAGDHRQSGRHRRHCRGRRRRCGRRAPIHRAAAGRCARHHDSGFGGVQPGRLGARGPAHLRRHSAAVGGQAGRRQGTGGAGSDADDTRDAGCAGTSRDARQPRRLHGRAAHLDGGGRRDGCCRGGAGPAGTPLLSERYWSSRCPNRAASLSHRHCSVTQSRPAAPIEAARSGWDSSSVMASATDGHRATIHDDAGFVVPHGFRCTPGAAGHHWDTGGRSFQKDDAQAFHV